jgi:hypothetical protein
MPKLNPSKQNLRQEEPVPLAQAPAALLRQGWTDCSSVVSCPAAGRGQSTVESYDAGNQNIPLLCQQLCTSPARRHTSHTEFQI